MAKDRRLSIVSEQKERDSQVPSYARNIDDVQEGGSDNFSDSEHKEADEVLKVQTLEELEEEMRLNQLQEDEVLNKFEENDNEGDLYAKERRDQCDTDSDVD